MTVDYRDLDRNIASTRIVVSLVGLLSIYVDPTIDEPFSIERDLLIVLILHRKADVSWRRQSLSASEIDRYVAFRPL